jgi:hypothetical protein
MEESLADRSRPQIDAPGDDLDQYMVRPQNRATNLHDLQEVNGAVTVETQSQPRRSLPSSMTTGPHVPVGHGCSRGQIVD